MKIIYFGTWEFSKNILSSLFTWWPLKIVATVSQPDKPVGRKKEYIPTPVHQFSKENTIPIFQPEKLRENTEFFQELRNFQADFFVVVAYGKIIPPEILDIPKYGCINIHGSILPAYRGASPIQESVKNGDTQTGVTIMYMSQWMDEGDILSTQKIDIEKNNTTPDVFAKFEHIAPKLLENTLQDIVDKKILPRPQSHEHATYCSKIEKENGHIFFGVQTGQQIYNFYRAYQPWPGIFTTFEGKILKILSCQFQKTPQIYYKTGQFFQENGQYFIPCSDGILEIFEVQLEWKKKMNIVDFVNGQKNILSYIFQ